MVGKALGIVVLCLFVTPAERAELAKEKQHQRDVARVIKGTPYPDGYGDAILAERDEAIQTAHNVLMAHEKAKPKGSKENSAWAARRNKLRIKWQRLKQRRLDTVPDAPFIGPTFSEVGSVGFIQHMEVFAVVGDSELSVTVGNAQVIGTRPALNTLGKPAKTPEFVYGKEMHGKGKVTNFPVNAKDRVDLAHYGLYQLVRDGEQHYELKWIGAVKH